MSAFQRDREILPLMQALLSVPLSPSDSPPLLPCTGILTDEGNWQMCIFPWDETDALVLSVNQKGHLYLIKEQLCGR